MGIDVPELHPWSLDARVNVSEEGEDVKDGRVDIGLMYLRLSRLLLYLVEICHLGLYCSLLLISSG